MNDCQREAVSGENYLRNNVLSAKEIKKMKQFNKHSHHYDFEYDSRKKITHLRPRPRMISAADRCREQILNQTNTLFEHESKQKSNLSISNAEFHERAIIARKEAQTESPSNFTPFSFTT